MAEDPEGLFQVEQVILRLVNHLSGCSLRLCCLFTTRRAALVQGEAPPSEDPNENVSLVLKTLISQAESVESCAQYGGN